MTLKTAYEWAELIGVVIIDPDGWRQELDWKSLHELISREEFMHRVSMSTVSLTSLP